MALTITQAMVELAMQFEIHRENEVNAKAARQKAGQELKRLLIGQLGEDAETMEAGKAAAFIQAAAKGVQG